MSVRLQGRGRVLNHLARLGGEHTPLQLDNAMQVTKGTMTNTLGHLQRAGWIAIAPDPFDGRPKQIALSPQGRLARDRAIIAVGPELAAIAALFKKAELEPALVAV